VKLAAEATSRQVLMAPTLVDVLSVVRKSIPTVVVGAAVGVGVGTALHVVAALERMADPGANIRASANKPAATKKRAEAARLILIYNLLSAGWR
jgi:hypothetical protein